MNWDKKLFWAVAGLTIFGLAMMSSMSVASSFDVTGKNDFYFWRHFLYLVMGAVAFVAALKFPVEWLRRWALPIFLVGIGLQILTLAIGTDYGTFAKLWIRVGPFSFQPVEFVKLAVVTFLAALFSSHKTSPETIEGGLLPFVVVLGIPCLFLMVQSDFGSLLVIAVTAAAMYFAAGARLKHFFGGVGVAALGATIVSLTVPYIRHRVSVFLNPDLDPLNAGFQVKQALIAIGSGGVFGRGFQRSVQKFDYLPEVQSDTIFSAIAEEMGFLRILMLLGVYLFIAWRGLEISRRVSDSFEKLLALGLTVWVVGQAFINIGVNLALLPNTGITLPLLSYGGSSMIMTLAALGLLLQLSTRVSAKKRTRHHIY